MHKWRPKKEEEFGEIFQNLTDVENKNTLEIKYEPTSGINKNCYMYFANKCGWDFIPNLCALLCEMKCKPYEGGPIST